MEISTGIAALLGTVIGGGITIIGAWLQQRQVTEREFVKIAKELAEKDINILIQRQQPNQKIQPIEAFVTYYVRYVRIIRKGNIELKDLKKLREFRKELNQFYIEESQNQ